MASRRFARILAVAAALALAGCSDQPASENAPMPEPVIEAPVPDSAVAEQPVLVPRMAEAPAPRVPCAVTGTRETEVDCAAMGGELSDLRRGVDAFRPEQPMVRGQTTIVRYSLAALPAIAQDSSDDSEAAREAIAEKEAEVSGNIVDFADRAEVETGRIEIGRRMFACLTGDPIFTIAPDNCSSVNMIENPGPTWRWEVTPREGGRSYKLFLRSGIEVEGPDGRPRRIGQYAKTEEITVEVSTLGRFQDAMRRLEIWLRSPLGVIAALTALVAAIGGLIAALRKAKGTSGA